MIGYISGKVVEVSDVSVTILPVSGVGYEICINDVIALELTQGEQQDLFIYHHITDNSQSLFGFLHLSEKQVFQQLIKISGVGGKVAMQILSLGIGNLIGAVANEDNKMIESIKGIGKKMAEKIILELKDKDFGIVIQSDAGEKQISQLDSTLTTSIKTTLVNMGYDASSIDEQIKKMPAEYQQANDILPYIIKQLS